MLDLSPVKLLLLLIVATILVGPDKLPQVARQLGAGWRRLRELHQQLDHEVRQNIPDLPSTQEIARFARSPVALLNQLAQVGADDPVEDPAAAAPSPGTAWPEDPSAAPLPGTAEGRPAPGALPGVGDDPSLN
jgi:Sec-independent protein translocase protein TatA